MAKNIVKINESQLKKIIAESVKKVLKEVSMIHSGHNLDDFLDDDDFLEIVKRTIPMYGKEDFEDDNRDFFGDIKSQIADLIYDFINDEAVEEWTGYYKYGTNDYNRTASNIFQYIQKHLDELYKK